MSLPTMIFGFTHYSRDQSFAVLGRNWAFLLVMAAGSIVGVFIGGRLLSIVSDTVLLPALVAILLLSAWRSGGTSEGAFTARGGSAHVEEIEGAATDCDGSVQRSVAR